MTELSQDVLVDMFIVAKRKFYNKEFIPRPKEGTAEYSQLIRLAHVLDDNGWDYDDYLRCQFKAFAHFKVFPSAVVLAGDKALKRYSIKVNRERTKITKLYRIEGDWFIVRRTGMAYPVHRVRLGVLEDPVSFRASEDLDASFDPTRSDTLQDAINDLEYMLAKFAYNGWVPPGQLISTLFKFKTRLEALHRQDEKLYKKTENPNGCGGIPKE